MLVDNRGGGNKIIRNDARSQVANTAPDGYTGCSRASSQVAIPHLYRNIPYDTINDFTPIAGIARSEFILTVHRPAVKDGERPHCSREKKPATRLRFVEHGGANPSRCGAFRDARRREVAAGSVQRRRTGNVDLLGGHVTLAFANPGSVLPSSKQGGCEPSP